jgi:hypothetical protein
MKKQIIATLFGLFGCTANTETNMPQDTSNKSHDAEIADVQDAQTEEDNIQDVIQDIQDTAQDTSQIQDIEQTENDASHPSDSEETRDSSFLDQRSEQDVNGIALDAGIKEASSDTSKNDAKTDAEVYDVTETDPLTNEASADCPRGCALQGRFACWPIQEHPTFESVASDFVVRDRCTGLHWEAHINASSTYYTFDDAERACKSKALPIPKGVNAKWRMASRLELASITDYSLGSPILNTQVFAFSLDQFWTSSQTADGLGWTLTMYSGKVNVKAKTQSYFGRCVLDPLGDHYEDDTMWHFEQSPGQFLDKGTLLTWEAGDNQNETARTFSSAQGYCQGIGERLPTLKELLTILDSEIVGAPGITVAVNSQLLPHALAGNYWTDTTVYDGGMTSRHWTLHFGTGLTNDNETTAYVRCVKETGMP